ncbi:MAG: hypothetical protein U0768_02480 [Anaerolineae bacterium]
MKSFATANSRSGCAIHPTLSILPTGETALRRRHGVYQNNLGVVTNGRFAVVGKTGDRAPGA